MKTSALFCSFVFLASAGFSSCSQLRGGTNEESLNDSTEMVDLESFQNESYIRGDGDDLSQRELAPSRIRIKVKNNQSMSIKFKAICRDSSNIIRETKRITDITLGEKDGTDITHNRCAKVEVKFWYLNYYRWDRIGKDSGSEIEINEDSGNEETRLYENEDDNDGFVIKPNEFQSVINNSKFCFKIAKHNLLEHKFIVKYRKDDDDCN